MPINIRVVSNAEEWNEVISSCDIKDVYFQYVYAQAMAIHFKARPVLVNCFDELGGFVYVLLINDIANDSKFKDIIPRNKYFDAETPYGYGGPYFYGARLDSKWGNDCRREIKKALVERGIIAQFIRFYPLTFLAKESTLITEQFATYKSTIYMDLKDEETIIKNLDSQYRRKVRKAREAGVVVEHDKGENIQEFIHLYNMTMQMHNADNIYFFSKEYYYYLIENFSKNIEMFYAKINGKVVGAAMFLFDEKYMHFHLGGRDVFAPNVPFDNILMVEAAKWGARCGFQKLHLGGGLVDGDSLFQYKKKYNRSGILPFYIGRTILDSERYNELKEIRKNHDTEFDENNKFFIQYRF